MKKLALIILLVVSLVSGCADSEVICGKEVEPYGLFSMEKKDDGVHYRTSWGDVFWGIVLVETIVVPIWLFGFELYQPVSPVGHC